jgi:hypothetical protein
VESAGIPYPKLKKPNNIRFYGKEDLPKIICGLGVAGV